MAGKKDTKFSSDNQPEKKKRKPRGEGYRTKLIKALKAEGQSEEDFYRYCVQVAMGTRTGSRGGVLKNQKPDTQMLKEIFKKIYPDQKSTLPVYNFYFPEEGSLLEQAQSIVMAMGSGEIPIDAGKVMLDSINICGSIEEKQDLVDRIEALEKLLNETLGKEDK